MNSASRILRRFRPKFYMQNYGKISFEILHAAFCGDVGQNSACKVSAEILHAELCGDFGRKYAFTILQRFQPKMHAEFCRNFGRNSARRVHLRMQPKFWTRRFRPKYLQKSEGRIWAKSLQNPALRISSQLSAEFSLQNFGQNGCRIVDAEFLTSSAFTQQIMQKQTEIVFGNSHRSRS